MYICIIDTKCKLLPSFKMHQNISKDWNILLKLFCRITPLVFKNTIDTIIGSKSEKFKNTRLCPTFSEKVGHSLKKDYIPLFEIFTPANYLFDATNTSNRILFSEHLICSQIVIPFVAV